MCGGGNKKKEEDQDVSRPKAPPPDEFFARKLSYAEVEQVDETNKPSKIQHIQHLVELANINNNAGDKLVVIDFYAPWCEPCRRMAPILETWVDVYEKDVLFIKANVDNCAQEMVELYNIQSVPTFIFLRNAKTVATFSGGRYRELKEILEKNRLGEEAKPPKKSVTTASLLRDGIVSENLTEVLKAKKPAAGSRRSKKSERTQSGRKKKDGSKQKEGRKRPSLSSKRMSSNLAMESNSNKKKNSTETENKPSVNSEPSSRRMSSTDFGKQAVRESFDPTKININSNTGKPKYSIGSTKTKGSSENVGVKTKN